MCIRPLSCLLALCLQITDAYDNRNSSGAGVCWVLWYVGDWVRSAKQGEVRRTPYPVPDHSSRRGLRPARWQCECGTKWNTLFASGLFWPQGEPYQSGQPNTYNNDNRNSRHRASRQERSDEHNNTGTKKGMR